MRNCVHITPADSYLGIVVWFYPKHFNIYMFSLYFCTFKKKTVPVCQLNYSPDESVSRENRISELGR